VPGFTGLGASYAAPEGPELRVGTPDGGVEQAAAVIFEALG
jgi:adenylylsulfate kinase-like enzyme